MHGYKYGIYMAVRELVSTRGKARGGLGLESRPVRTDALWHSPPSPDLVEVSSPGRARGEECGGQRGKYSWGSTRHRGHMEQEGAHPLDPQTHTDSAAT